MKVTQVQLVMILPVNALTPGLLVSNKTLRGVLIAIIFTETIRSRAHFVLGRGNGATRRRHRT